MHQPTSMPLPMSYQAVSQGRTGLPRSSSTNTSNWWWSPNQPSFTTSGFVRMAFVMNSASHAFRPYRA